MEVPVESRHDGERLSPFSCILVAVDGSNASLEAAQVAVRMASLHQLPVVALYVVDDGRSTRWRVSLRERQR